MRIRAFTPPRLMTPGSTWTNGGTPMIVLWSSAEFLLPAASCFLVARSNGNLRRETADGGFRQ